MPSFYEFFAGGGMARAGLGKNWECLFANDVDDKKCEIYRANWGTDELKAKSITDLRSTDMPRRPDLVCLGLVSLSGFVGGRAPGRIEGIKVRHILVVLAFAEDVELGEAGTIRRCPGERVRCTNIPPRERFRGHLWRSYWRGISVGSIGCRCNSLCPTIAASAFRCRCSRESDCPPRYNK